MLANKNRVWSVEELSSSSDSEDGGKKGGGTRRATRAKRKTNVVCAAQGTAESVHFSVLIIFLNTIYA